MPPLVAFENRVLDLLVPALTGIGTPASGWLSPVPEVHEGVPPDAVTLPQEPGQSVLYVQHVRTEPAEGDVGTSTHSMRATFAVWIFSITQRIALNMKADVLRAVYALEGPMTTEMQQPLWPREATPPDDMKPAGFAVVAQVLSIDYSADHTNP